MRKIFCEKRWMQVEKCEQKKFCDSKKCSLKKKKTKKKVADHEQKN